MIDIEKLNRLRKERGIPEPVGEWRTFVYGHYNEHAYEIRILTFEDGSKRYSTTVSIKNFKKVEPTLDAMCDYFNLGLEYYGGVRDRDWINGQIEADFKNVLVWETSFSEDGLKTFDWLMDKMHEVIDSLVRLEVKR